MQDFNTSFTFDETPQQVFEAVTNVRGWWSAALKGESQKLGDSFEYRHGDLHYSKHELIEVVPNQRVVWLTTDGSINFVKNKQEWNNTQVVFELTQANGKTILQFTHQGLVPQKECFEACSGGWCYYLDSLRRLIVTGKGNPDAA